GGTVTGGSTTPVFYSNATILMVAYQVKVTAAVNSTITTGGVFHYNSGTTRSVTATNIVVSNYYSCGSQGSTNSITSETSGTFGSGTALNRGSSASVTGYTYNTLGANSPVDGDYSIVKNTSYTQYSGSSPASSDKVFGVWDVVGDHSGTTNGTGNAPPASGSPAGYLLAVNATFAPATVFTITANSLLANSTYTVSLWVRNICPQCSANPATGTAGTTPGVSPNLAINVNGNNYYSTGNIDYTGQWVQKSFTFVNGSSTTATIDIKNNAPGGGGNDYVLDDIAMRQCLVVLPLGLQSFSGRSTARGILLDWQLSPWQGLQSFTIERSTEGTQFFSVGHKDAYPDSASYQYTDALLPSSGSTLYYRIRMDNNDGTSQYSNIVVLQTTDDSPDVLTTRLSPNPARTATTLAIRSAHAGPADITLWSPAGSMIRSRKTSISRGTTAVSLDLPAYLPTGIYIVRTTTSSESAVTRLVIE
ncbi:MAG: T9SS type A sorting domain-containing protein, partial [Bacteroidetes bacterium]|nr:T9SS type A sorting domain-containing protein [Bacteroidota bacterium]